MKRGISRSTNYIIQISFCSKFALYIFFIYLFYNREYFLEQKFNRYFNPYPYYLLILLVLQQLNLLF